MSIKGRKTVIEEPNMKFCGIDLSLRNTGIVVLNNKGKIQVSSLIKSGPEDRIELRIRNIYKSFTKNTKLSVLSQKFLKINIEGLAFGLRGQRMLELAGLHYYFRVNLLKAGFNFIVTPPTILKKYVTGKGNSKKNLMLLHVYKKWGECFTDDNLADAYGLSRMVYDETVTTITNL